jgi:hypothetical protein
MNDMSKPVLVLANATNRRPDAALIAACNRFWEIEDYFDAKYGHGDIDNDEPALGEQSRILDKVAALQARSLEGHRARAKLIACRFPRVLWEGKCGGEMETMIATLLRDLIGEARA